MKNPASSEHGVIRYHDIGDYLTREEKLSIVASAVSGEPFEWDFIEPDRHGDWLNQRDDSWYDFMPLGLSKYKAPSGLFTTWSLGIATNRDAWMTNYSETQVLSNMKRFQEFYEEQVISYQTTGVLDMDKKKISWTDKLQEMAKKGASLQQSEQARIIHYRPFNKQFTYMADSPLVHRPYQQPKLFPDNGLSNVALITSERGPFITNVYPDLELMHHGQCFPLYWYERGGDLGGLFASTDVQRGEYVRHDAITDEALEVFRSVYPNAFGGGKGRTIDQAKADGLPSKIANSNERFDVNKVDIFYYVYGILHSPEYRNRFEANLQKELPRIPLSRNFREFCAAGRALAKLHLGYEAIEPWPVKEVGSTLLPGPVQKIKWGKRKDPETGKKVDDHTVLIYNENLVIKDIPEAAQRYTVNGRSPLEWVIDRYQVKTDKASGIVNDPNEYSDDPRYIVDLIEKLIRVSMETMEIIDQLPPVSELSQPANWPFAWKADA